MTFGIEVLSCFLKKVNKHGVDEDVLHTAQCSFLLASQVLRFLLSITRYKVV